jgi:hypothetical protein
MGRYRAAPTCRDRAGSAGPGSAPMRTTRAPRSGTRGLRLHDTRRGPMSSLGGHEAAMCPPRRECLRGRGACEEHGSAGERRGDHEQSLLRPRASEICRPVRVACRGFQSADASGSAPHDGRRSPIAQERLSRTADGRILLTLMFTSVGTTSRMMGIADTSQSPMGSQQNPAPEATAWLDPNASRHRSSAATGRKHLARDIARAGAKDHRRGTPARGGSCPNVAAEAA